MLDSYLKALFTTNQHGDATEQSYYSDLKNMVEHWAVANATKTITATILPKSTDAGNPDFQIWDSAQHITGYIEAKLPTADLDQVERSEQLTRYRSAFPNLILTNFLEFRLYRDGKLIDKVMLGRPLIFNEARLAPPAENTTEFAELLNKFMSFSIPKISTAKALAIELAKRTKFLRDDIIKEELAVEATAKTGNLYGFYTAFKEYLIHSLTVEEFADLYAQTVTYGLFAARMRADGDFNRTQAVELIPHSIGVLHDVFRFISSADLPDTLKPLINDISEVLNAADPKKIMHKYYQEGKGRDPVIHFYETFLTEYDPATRERRGVYYTPEPVVKFIVKSVHHILKDVFGKVDGLADPSVTVLDPAGGTLTFLAEAAKVAVEEFTGKYGDGGKAGLIKDHILRDFYAFELMMAPYAIGHLKMGFLLEELGYKLTEDDRFKMYLTNTLEMDELPETKIPGVAGLSKESHLATEVKKNQPILVIMGNPPYSGISTNVSDWITGLIDAYKWVDGKPLGEKKHWLNDDYVKFLRFAQWKIDQAGFGVVGMITNHGYLDNPTFRGMRQSLMNSFSDIYILNLHGNSLKKETGPDGSVDENVFDIRTGVAIALFVKKNDQSEQARVWHADFFGTRESKYDRLDAGDVKSLKWEEVHPKSPYYLFTDIDYAGSSVYGSFPQVNKVFPENVSGIVTARDHFVIDFDKQNILRRVSTFLNPELTDDEVRTALNIKENYAWRVKDARTSLRKAGALDKFYTHILYRPFDVRQIIFHESIVWRTRKEIMRHIQQDNLCLVMPKRVEISGGWHHSFVAKNIVDHVAVSSKTVDYVMPLYLYPDTDKDNLFSQLETDTERQPNLDPQLVAALTDAYGAAPSPEDIFYYIYAVLYAPAYRTKYTEFLRIDFPRVPFTADHDLFKKLAALGERLTALHLLKSKDLDKPIARFQGAGDNIIVKPVYDEATGSVHINDTQYFAPISADLWNYHVGGYQVLHKWLKDRKGRILSTDDIIHYCRVATALAKTIELQIEIDRLYPQVEGSLLNMDL